MDGPMSGITKIIISALRGVVVFEGTAESSGDNLKIDISSLSTGLHIVRPINDGDVIQQFKITKNWFGKLKS